MELLLGIFVRSWNVMATMAPWLLFGLLAAGLLAVFVPVSFIETHLGRRGLRQIAKASLIGVPAPLCSCGVIPVAASLRRHGATKGATIGFLTSTPQIGVNSIAATWGLLGPLFTVFRVVVSFVTGFLCGAAVESFTPPEEDASFQPEDPATGATAKPRTWRTVLTYGFGTLPRDIGRALILGVLVSGLLGALLPDDFFARHLGSEWLSMLLAMGIGIPLYVCSTASIPVALGLIASGLSPGAALVFLVSGPATNAATLTTVNRTMGRRALGVYLLTLALCSLAAGLLMNRLPGMDLLAGTVRCHETAPSALQQISALVLCLVLTVALFPRRAKPRS